MRSARGLAVALCGTVLCLAACADGDDEPIVLPTITPTTSEPTVSATPTDTPTSDPTPTTTLVLPDEHVPEVDAFVQGFFDAYNAAQDSGDLSSFDAMYLPQCSGCLEMRAELEGWLSDGGAVEGADWVILQQSSSKIAGNFNALLVAYRTNGTRIVGSDEQPIDPSPAEPITLFLASTPALSIADLGLGGSS